MRKEVTSQKEAEKLQVEEGWNNVETKGNGDERVYVMEKTDEQKAKEVPKKGKE
jgi:hypothetical protein